MGSPKRLPDSVVFLSSASRDLERMLKRTRDACTRIWRDLIRLGNGTLPPQGKKKLKGVDAFQIDSGRYRIVYSRRDASYVIWAVFAKPDQQDDLKRLRA